jgi:hypothetical protein
MAFTTTSFGSTLGILLRAGPNYSFKRTAATGTAAIMRYAAAAA